MTSPLDEKTECDLCAGKAPVGDAVVCDGCGRAYLSATPAPEAEVKRLTEENEALGADAARYAYLRDRDLDTIHNGGVFAGSTPENIVLNGADLDQYIDDAMAKAGGLNAPS